MVKLTVPRLAEPFTFRLKKTTETKPVPGEPLPDPE